MSKRRDPAPTQRDFDHEFRAQLAQMTAGLAPTAFTTAWADWAMHLAQSPTKVAALQQEAAARASDTWGFALRADCFDLGALGTFIDDHYARAPEDLCGDGVDPLDPQNGFPSPCP